MSLEVLTRGGGKGAFASIFVSGLSEADTITATKDGKMVQGKWNSTENRFEIKRIKEYGIWPVIATNGEKTTTQDVIVNAAVEYEIEMGYRLWLYREGEEFEDVTGGWKGYAADWSAEVKGQFSTSKQETYLECSGSNGSGSCFFTTANSVDVTNYTRLHFVSQRTNSSGSSRLLLCTTKPHYESGSYYPIRTDVLEIDFPSTEKTEAVLDISGITGEIYVIMLLGGYTSYLYEVWLE